MTVIRQKRWVKVINVIVGASILMLAFWGYRFYNQSFNQEPTSLASVARLQVTDFKLIYDKWLADADRHGDRDADAQWAVHEPTQETSQRGPYIIDVRLPAKYSEGHIRGAISMPETELEVCIRSVVPPSRSGALIVLYCA